MALVISAEGGFQRPRTVHRAWIPPYAEMTNKRQLLVDYMCCTYGTTH